MKSFQLLPMGLATVALCASIQAQTPCAIVQDINTVPTGRSSNLSGDRLPLPGNHFARGFAKCGNDWYFTASTIAHGEELWKTNGTPGGTVRVSDIAPGPSSAGISAITCIDIGAGPRLWFRANNGTAGTELWTSDGTAAGTRMVADIRAGSSSSSPYYMAKLGNKVVFTANDGSTGTELWITDGTTAGTTQLKDILPGTSSSSPAYLLPNVAGNTIYFRASDGTTGTELWKTDGTAAGTVIVADLRPGTSSSFPSYLINHNGKILFSAGGPSGTELWETNGTAAGTVMVKDINPGTGSSSPYLYYTAVIGADLFFRANDGSSGSELWKTNGTAAGTVMVADIRPGTSSGSPTDFYAAGTKLYFEANDGTTGTEPYVYDGTSVTALGDIRPGSSSSSPGNYTSIGAGRVLFSASSGTTAPGTGYELYVTDGTPAGTSMVKDINPGTASSSPSWFTPMAGGSSIMFSALAIGSGRELWFSGGTSGSTILFKDIEPLVTTGSSYPFWGSAAAQRRSIDGSTLYMEADDGLTGDELWRVKNGVAAPIKDIWPGTGNSDPREFTELFNGTKLLTVFEANDGTNGSEPWVTDGTPSGTVLLKDIRSGSSSSSPHNWVRLGEKVLFTANNGSNGTEIWVTDGTPAGTVMLKDIRPGSSSASVSYLTYWNGAVWFAANDGTNGTELWVTDGTPAGTFMRLDLNPGSASSSPAYFTPMNGKLYFRALRAGVGSELWATDGTVAGTVMVKDLNPGSSSSSPFNLVACNGKLIFSAVSGSGSEPHVSDGTAAGTVMLKDIYPGTSGSSPSDLTCSGNYVYFDAFDGTSSTGTGRELYRTDGTAAGTVLVVDLRPGTSSSSPDYYVPAGANGIYLENASPANGSELYYSDGTAAGTTIVCENIAGATSTSPLYLTYVGKQLYFRANSDALGYELFRLPMLPRAHTLNYGQGCGPDNGEIRSTAPVLNSTAVVSGTAPSGVPSVALLGIPSDVQPLIGSAPCALHLNLLLPTLNLGAITSTNWSLNLAIPNDPGLMGGEVVAQAIYVYGAPVLARTSDAVRLVIGN